MAEEVKVYPPAFIKPGDTTRLSAENGQIEFIGVYDEKAVDYIVASYELLKAIDGPMRPSPASMAYLERKAAKAFNDAPAHLKKIVMEKSNTGGIWIPEGGDDGA